MAHRRVGEAGFVDGMVSHRGKRDGETVQRVSALINWAAIDQKIGPLYPSRTGELAYPPLVMFKILLLQAWYGLSDPEMENAMDDRLSFGRFAGLSLEERSEIPAVLTGIGTPAAANALLENVLERDVTLRFKVICALNKLHRDHPEIPLDLQMLETVLAAEILGHYRTYQLMEAISGPGSAEEVVGGALADSLQQELERIFRLMGLLYPQVDLHAVYIGLQSKDRTVHDNSLEFLENFLKSALRATLVPLLDGKVTPKERARLADRLVHTKLENREQAVNELVSNDDPWLKSCGAFAIGSFRMKSLAKELEHCLSHADPLLRETARAAKLRLEDPAAES